MRGGSPRLDERKAGHVKDQAAHTIAKVLQDQEVLRVLEKARARHEAAQHR
jgi:hypothetical protein